MDVIKIIMLELGKFAQFIIIWGLPLLLAKYFESNAFLLLLIGSVIMNYGLWEHYEHITNIIFGNNGDKTESNKQGEANEQGTPLA